MAYNPHICRNELLPCHNTSCSPSKLAPCRCARFFRSATIRLSRCSSRAVGAITTRFAHAASVAKHYFIKIRRQWRCRDCNHTFSVTSGTIFDSHKLPLKVYLAAIAIYCNAVKGLSALQLARDLDVQNKTAFALAHKIRE